MTPLYEEPKADYFRAHISKEDVEDSGRKMLKAWPASSTIVQWW